MNKTNIGSSPLAVPIYVVERLKREMIDPMNPTDQHLPPTNMTSTLRADCPDIVREYCRLAAKQYLSPANTARMLEISQLAESDSWLDFWLTEADHFMAHELDLTNEASIYSFENQQAHLREHLENGMTEEAHFTLLEEIECRVRIVFEELQQHLKNRGFDPGRIDGVLGTKTKSALIAFQSANHLVPNGLPDQTTREALGLS